MGLLSLTTPSIIKLNSLLKNSQIPYKWYRPFYVYGINQSKKSLIPSTLHAASKGIILEHNKLKNHRVGGFLI